MEREHIVTKNEKSAALRGFKLHPKLAVALKLVISLGLLGGLVAYVNVGRLERSLLHAHAFYISLGFALMAANVGIQFIRWRFLLRLLEKDVSDRDVISSLLIGFSAGFFTPAQVGEYGGRIVSLPSQPTAKILAMSIVDKVYLFAIVALAGTSSAYIYFSSYLPQYWSSVFSALVAIIVLSDVTVLLYPRLLKYVLKLFSQWFRRFNPLSTFLSINDVFGRRQARRMLLLTLAWYGVVILQYYIFVLAFEPVAFHLAFICTANVLFVKSAILPISFGDLGVRESAAIFFFSRIGVSAASAFNASMCIFMTNIVIPGIAGAIMITKLKVKRT
jgi:uncharacterized protein (TIRG00374 family)